MSFKLLFDIILGILTILSFILAFISEEYRIPATILAFVLMIVIIISLEHVKINEIATDNFKLHEKLKIYEQLIDIKSELKYLNKRFDILEAKYNEKYRYK
ncbi:MAG: hypothetical protein Q7S74_00330 [Nanoarchaeota archaeon]|nr:hypothetical protein [Nanoarchaeota archaeon]